jgi:hypothetical protein
MLKRSHTDLVVVWRSQHEFIGGNQDRSLKLIRAAYEENNLIRYSWHTRKAHNYRMPTIMINDVKGVDACQCVVKSKHSTNNGHMRGMNIHANLLNTANDEPMTDQ